MPDPYDRHASPGDGWDPQPSRSQMRRMAAMEDGGDSRAADDPLVTGKRAPGRKNRDLCKAAHWKGPHQPVLRMQEYGWRRNTGCRWNISWRSRDGEPSWHCNHEEICAGCGKVLRTGIEDSECPDFHPITEGERMTIEAKRAEDDARIRAAAAGSRSRWQPRPVITGPQGYRRKRGAA